MAYNFPNSPAVNDTFLDYKWDGEKWILAVGGIAVMSAPVAQFINRTSGLDATHIAAYTTLIDGLVTDGIWSKFDVLRIYATNSSANAVLNLVSSSYTGTINGSPTFTVDRGFTGVDASTTININSNFNAATAPSPKFVAGACHMSTWGLVAGTYNPPSGCSVTAGCYVWPKYSGDSKAYIRILGHISVGGSVSVLSDVRGLCLGTNNATNQQLYMNGAAVGVTVNTGNFGVQNANFGELGQLGGGCGQQQAMSSIGGLLTAAEVTLFYNRLLAYMTAVSGAGTEAQAFLARTTGLDIPHIFAYAALINGLVADGIWAKLDVLYIFATQDSTTAKLNLISSSFNATQTGSPTFTVDRGFNATEGVGGAYLDSGFNPATATSPKYTQNSAHLSVWNVNVSTTTTNTSINAGDGTRFAYLISKYTTGSDMYTRINRANSGGVFATAGDAHGLQIGNRSGANDVQQYVRGGGLGSSSGDTSNGVPNGTFTLLAACGLQYASASIGSSLSAGDVTLFTNRMNTYMAAMGITAP